MSTNVNIKKMITQSPLVLFSPYSAIQANNLRDIGKDISRRLSKDLRENGKVGKGFIKTYGYISLWIFGAYEMVRTLHQEKNIFNQETQLALAEFKKKISELRMPLAKQELAKSKIKSRTESSITDFDFDKKDFTFQVKGREYQFKELLKEYNSLINSIKEDSFI